MLRSCLLLLLALLLVTAGCSGAGPEQEQAPSGSSASSSAPAPKATAEPPRIRDARPDTSLDALPTAADRTRARRLVGRMSLPQLAGQVLVARYDGTRAPVGLVRDLHLGGVIVFDDNVASTRQVRSSNRTLRGRVDRPLLVGVDQEGGIVERVQEGATRFPAFMAAGAADDPALTRAAARGSGAELMDLGFDAVFAPDADVTSGPGDPTIGSRSAGSDPALVSRHVRASLAGFLSTGILPVVKHFPGHGSVSGDSHEVLPVQKRSRAELARTDLVPFRDAVRAGAPAIMTGHLDVRAVDPGVPASLSRRVTTGLLRDRLGFEGLVVTDALDMEGITDDHAGGPAAVRALRAGADVLLMPPDPAAARAGIVRAVRDGTLPRKRLAEAATRMLAFLASREEARKVTAAPGSRSEASGALSAGAVTVVSGPCRGRLVGPRVQLHGSADHVAAFRAAASRAGLPVGSTGTNVALTGWDGSPVDADVAVALDTPYVLADSHARVRIATFGDTPGAMDALVRVLLGKQEAPGRLPVPVRGADKGC